jgi:hypothetical protein
LQHYRETLSGAAIVALWAIGVVDLFAVSLIMFASR